MRHVAFSMKTRTLFTTQNSYVMSNKNTLVSFLYQLGSNVQVIFVRHGSPFVHDKTCARNVFLQVIINTRRELLFAILTS